VLAVFFTVITLRSSWRLLVRRSVTWKGREIAVRGDRAPTALPELDGVPE
jgi:hypothetical protein